jgi:hypothetical protein
MILDVMQAIHRYLPMVHDVHVEENSFHFDDSASSLDLFD